MVKEASVISCMSNRGVLMSAKDVLYVPTLRKNLMSVKKLTKADVEVVNDCDSTSTRKKSLRSGNEDPTGECEFDRRRAC